MRDPSPAPWRPLLDHPRTGPRKRMALVNTSNGRTSIDFTGSGEDYAQDCANARLGAQAPELLAALKAIARIKIDEHDDSCAWCTGTEGTKKAIGIAKAAIAKVKGR